MGLLTGDTTLHPRAPVVVMTTEVLRNMLLAGSDLLEGLHTVVLDEVHFIQDPYRGGVWEEVLVLSPPEIRFVCLSATVNNAGELGGWLHSVRGDTAVIVERERPIVLRHHFAVHRREDDETVLCPLLTDNGQPADEGLRVDQAVRRALQGRSAHWQPRGRGPRLPVRAPLRTEIVEELDVRDMLPAIVFIFSRAACDDAVRQVLRDGVRLTDGSERTAIRAIAERRVEGLGTRTCACSATTSGSRDSSGEWRRTMPGSCPSSARPSRSASQPDCSRWCSRPRRCPWASTCRPVRS